MLADAADQLVIAPLVDDDQVALQRRLQIQAGEVIQMALQVRIRRSEFLDRAFPVLSDEVLPAPRIPRLEHLDLVPAGQQLGHYAAQKMGVAVVPVREQRVIEHHNAHGGLSCGRRPAISTPLSTGAAADRRRGPVPTRTSARDREPHSPRPFGPP